MIRSDQDAFTSTLVSSEHKNMFTLQAILIVLAIFNTVKIFLKIAAFSLTYYLKTKFINRTQGKPKKQMKNGTQAFLIIRSAYKI